MNKQNSVNKKALLIVSFIFLLSFALIVSTFWFKGSMKEVYGLIDHATKVEIALRDMSFTVKDGEGDMRAYVITNEEAYYNSFITNRSYVWEKMMELRKSIKDSLQAANSVLLSRYLEERFALLEQIGHFSDTLNLAQFQRIVRKGELISNKIEAQISQMVAYEKKILEEHERNLFFLMDVRRKVSIFGSLLAMALGIFIFKLIREESALIQKRQKLLQELNSNKDQFFSIISHDLKNPFTAIKGYIEFLNENKHHLDQESLNTISTQLKSSSDRFSRLLSDLLTWARLQMNMVSINEEPINISELLHRVSGHYSALMESKNLKLEIEANKALYGFADKAMTETILRNLISNAVKFTEKGTIRLTAGTMDRRIVIEVADTGTGMNESTVKDLFQIGKVNSQKGTRNETGSGMGLILCRDMAERQGGQLQIVSAPGKGTNVKLIL